MSPETYKQDLITNLILLILLIHNYIIKHKMEEKSPFCSYFDRDSFTGKTPIKTNQMMPGFFVRNKP